jgi:hypothetical protein
LINCVEKLFQDKNVTMFVNKEIFLIHHQNQPCGISQNQSKVFSKHKVFDFITNMYPKQKYLTLVFELIIEKNLIDDRLYFIDFSNVHVADFCTFINNKFGKINLTDHKYIKLCKYLQTQKLQFPKVSIKNPVAHKYLC